MATNEVDRDATKSIQTKQIARITEDFETLKGARIAAFMLAISCLVAIVLFVVAGTAADRAVAILLWIGATLFWGGAIVLARRRVLTVHGPE